MCVCFCVCARARVCIQCFWRSEEDVHSFGTGGVGGCKLSDIDAKLRPSGTAVHALNC